MSRPIDHRPARATGNLIEAWTGAVGVGEMLTPVFHHNWVKTTGRVLD
jgi:hypothetical protein